MSQKFHIFVIKINMEDLIKLHGKGLSDTQISEIIGVSKQMVFYTRKKLGLKSNFTYSSRVKIEKPILLKLVNDKLTDSDISKLLNVKEISVWNARKRYNISRESFNSNKSILLSQRQISIIKGCLLGDGSMRKLGVNPSFSCEHGIKQKDYCFWKYQELSNCGFTYSEAIRKTPDKRNGILYQSATVRCGARTNFLDIYNTLYFGKNKRITKEFINDFDELSLAVMFMDDGSKTKQSIIISTNCFDIESLNVFNQHCNDRWGIEFNIIDDNKIYLPVKYFNKFYNITKEFIHESMMYKLNVPLKSDKLLENPEEDNQQPIISLND